jgi:hypothetical protein
MKRPLFACLALTMALGVAAGCGTSPPVPIPAPAPSAPASATPSPSAIPSASPVFAPVTVPAGITAGIAVFDRGNATYPIQVNADARFRSASLVKILIALDYLWTRGPTYAMPAEDKHQMEIMLRGSDDNAASYFWRKIGGEQSINRMVARLSLTNTKPPSAAGLNGWGSTTLSANDLVRVYQYILDTAPAPQREIIMSNLHAATPCGTDRYYQSFGIPSAFDKHPHSFKQGWWSFGDAPAQVCTPAVPKLPIPATAPVISGAKPGMMNGRILHTTGTDGEADRYIVIVLTQYPNGTVFTDAAANLTLLTRALPVPS